MHLNVSCYFYKNYNLSLFVFINYKYYFFHEYCCPNVAHDIGLQNKISEQGTIAIFILSRKEL